MCVDDDYKQDCPACRLKRFWYEDLKFCGCGSPQETLGIFRDVMQILYDRADFNNPVAWQKGCDDLRAYAEPRFLELILKVLDAQDMVEHGSIITGSWLTDKGKDLLGLIGGKTNDELYQMMHEHNHD